MLGKMQQETIDNKKQIHGFLFPIRMENTISRYNLCSSHVI